jgi:hypothetical protein
VHAVALSLEALRAVDRYGVMRGRQYDGFKAIAAPAAPVNDLVWAWSQLGHCAHLPDAQVKADPKAAYREACKRHHPDTGGNAVTFMALQKAWRMIAGETPAP